MFEDEDFVRDKNSVAYKQVKPTEARQLDVDSEDEREKPQASNALNNLFSGNKDGEDEATKEKDFLSKLDKKSRKNYKKESQKDKITKDAQVLLAGQLKMAGVSEKSKKIKKGAASKERAAQITKESVEHKLKTRRLAIPQYKIIQQ